MLADSIPGAKSDLAELRMEMRAGFEQVKAEIKAEINGAEARLMRWMLGFFIPLWAGTWAVVAVLAIGR